MMTFPGARISAMLASACGMEGNGGHKVIRRYTKIGLFIGLSFLFSWLTLLGFLILGGTWNSTSAYPVAVLYMFGPALAAVTTQRVYGDRVREPLMISFRLNRWFLVAWFLPIFIALVTLGAGILLPGVSYAPDMAGLISRYEEIFTADQVDLMREQLEAYPVSPLLLMLGQAVAAAVTINAAVAFGEELGWRGLMLRELRFMSFWRSSVLIGLTWGVWHAPIILQGHNYPDNPVPGVFMMIAASVLLSPLFTYVTLRARSVIAASVMHGAFNASGGLAVAFAVGGSDLTVGVTGLTGLAVLLVANLLMYLYDRHLAAERII